jgi:hypothetical protein
MTIGVFILPFAVLAAVGLARQPTARPLWPAALFGAGLPLLFVAYLNREGPGEVCHAIAGGESCTQEFNPLPWLVAGALVIAVAVLFLRRSLRQQRSMQ